ncbi:glycoside hydrolase family 3 N-terminal domain-containing protein [Halorussus halophilus]|uniref:glycoside hydrolase family 3 N-terminal domain-containing protein n=1 Tax=Halorussus halophilus TaxID=2650975 RepID=UPI001CE415F2|nr:glycoside hydrolase family 3 N-terminal domain-containing protein [Halorussus halophilus]
MVERDSDAIDESRRNFMQATGGVATTTALSAYVGSGMATAQSADPSPEVEKKVENMSLDEKIGQMTQVAAYELGDDPTSFFEEYLPGSIMYASSKDAVEQAKNANDLQEKMVEAQPHDVPFVWGLDAVHGNNNLKDAIIFPHNHGLGATWNPDYARQMAEHTSKTLRATGTPWTFSPVADINRDPRWGRFYEGFSQDPYLASQMVSEKVRGYETKEGDHKRAGSTTKHFAGYSEPRNGNDRSAAQVPYRTFRSTLLPPYHAGISAGSETVMVNSGSLNGIPAHASEELLEDILREMLGFEGMVVSDWHDFYRMVEVHEFAADVKEAAKLGINAGIDMYMVPAGGIESDTVETYQQNLTELVQSGEVPMERIDDAVTNVLAFKEALGLFDDASADPKTASKVVGSDEARALAGETAADSMTLLKNDGTLPLDPSVGTLLVTGPSADTIGNMTGAWTLGWQGPGEVKPPAVTPLEAIEERVSSSTNVVHVPTGLHSFESESKVRDAAESADAVVAVIGEGPYAEEKGDTDTLELPSAQQRLVETLAGVETPHAGVFFAGRPRGTDVFENLPAALMAYLPGTMGGPAVADSLFGDHNPSGRLPFTWPEGTGQLLNLHNNYPPDRFHSGGDPGPPHSNQDPLFPFGHGESYTEFTYSDLDVTPAMLPKVASNDEFTVSVTVTNSGDRAGDHVVPVYGSRRHGPVLFPQEEIVGFDRVSLAPGESTRVTVRGSIMPLATVPGGMFSQEELTVISGDYTISVGDMTATLTVK